MKIITSVAEMQRLALAEKRGERKVALVPTMGYLHEGHASLMRAGRRRGDFLVTSIFVNPKQFGAGEDLERYPRDLARDTALAEASGVDALFVPEAADMYPREYQTTVEVERVTLPLCGASRPGHFAGVTTVVCKLFNIVQPDVALFGKKDYQQLAVIRRMTADLNMPVDIVGMPIIREDDGLAMSSRNSYLSSEERRSALCLSQALRAARAAFADGETGASAIVGEALRMISAEPAAAVDYVELRDAQTLETVRQASETSLLALAVRIGRTRLIDNTILGEEERI